MYIPSSSALFPFLTWFKTYDGKSLTADLIAGLTVAVVLIPQAMAYAMLAGLPPVYGLYAGLVGAGIASLWGSSSQLATGPVAIVSFLVLTSLSSFATPETQEYIGLAMLLALLVGLVQFGMGVFRLGSIVNFVSHSVIIGFANAAAIIIASTQIPSLLGIKVGQHELVFETFIDIARHIPQVHIPTLIVAATSIAAILLMRKIHKAFPAALVVVVASILTSLAVGFETMGIKVVGAVPSGLPTPALPPLSFDVIGGLLGTAIIISLIGFMEAYAIARSIGAKVQEKINVNQELIGQGLANIAAGIFRGYPISGSFSRSAVNNLAGAKTGMAGVFVSAFVLLTLLFLTPFLYALPKAVLAAVVIVAVIGLVDVRQFSHAWKLHRSDGIVAVVTAASAFLMKPDYAIFIGVFLSLALFISETARPRVQVRAMNGAMNGKDGSGDVSTLVIQPERALYFANIDTVLEKIARPIQEHKPCDVVLDCSSVNSIDATAVEALHHFIHEGENNKLRFSLAHVKKPVRDVLTRAHMNDHIQHT